MKTVFTTVSLVVALVAAVILLNGSSAVAQQAGDLNCDDFPNQAAAQAHYRADPSDPDDLDRDQDGLACEDLLPAPYDLTPVSRQVAAPTPTVAPQTQAPAQQTAAGICQTLSTAGSVAAGGSTVSLASTKLVLPTGSGDFLVGFAEANPPSIWICHRATQAGIILNATNGLEVRREAATTGGTQILDAVRNAVGKGGSSITAPNTGDAGLR